MVGLSLRWIETRRGKQWMRNSKLQDILGWDMVIYVGIWWLLVMVNSDGFYRGFHRL